ncbi:MAG: hypothetical protein HEQ22_16130 [Sphingopyxis sp.]|uniref:hypothetical protein n=1 Tax=Sphingopyxis sp. TaxID=1908224 RepID=UPI003D811194
MDFLKLIQSLDELLYEIMSWLVFYPVTLWRTLTRPLKMMDYSDAELGDATEKQYTDTLSPPLFLLLTLAIGHAIELWLVGQNALVGNRVGLSAFISDDSSLILLRTVTFSLFPLLLAARLLHARSRKLDRDTLRAPFYSQCYLAAPFALLSGLSENLIRYAQPWSEASGVLLYLFALLWFGTLQILWFRQHLKCGFWRAFGNASLAMVLCLGVIALTGTLFA